MPKPYSRYKNKGYYMCRNCNATRLKAYYRKCKQKVYEHYGKICACCGETEENFLSIDHVNNDGYSHRWKNGNRVVGSPLYVQVMQMGYPNSFQILCMNCNFGKRMNDGICPHKNKQFA